MCNEIAIPFPNFNGTSKQFVNGQVISLHTLLGIWLLIHAGIKVNSYW